MNEAYSPSQRRHISDVCARNYPPGKEDISLFFDRRLIGKMEPPLRSQSFPESLNWTQFTSPNMNSMPGGRGWDFSNKYESTELNIERPSMIKEDVSDLTVSC